MERVTNIAGQARHRLAAFGRAEDGTLIIFALVLFLLMAMMGGIAVDLMRYEATRTTLQNTLDRSTLAAASLTQELDAEDVVNDYFDKAGMSEFLTAVEVDEGLNYKEVHANARAETHPFFLHMIGYDEFEAPGASTAEQRMSNVEVMLVLDVSGSMGSNNRLTNLKSAATEFVDTVLSSDAEQRISIGLVPFNGQVNLGSALRAKFNVADNHGVANVNCIDLPASVYSTLGMSRTLSMPMTAHADTYSGTNNTTSYVDEADNNYATPAAGNRWCPPSTANIVRLPNDNIATLQGQINGLTSVGATSINAGLKWGVALMDPSARGMFSEFINANAMPSAFQERPFEYDDAESMKVIVLMTDGEHFAEERVNAGYRSGMSPIYRSAGDGNYSLYWDRSGTNSDYWVPHRNEWRTAAWNSGSGVAQQTWPQVWERQRISWVAWQLYARALGTNNSSRNSQYNTWMANFRSRTATSTMDSQLQQICSMAKNEGVIIYGIAFEAPENGRTQISQCASSAAHYFNAQGLQIRTAFRAIATNISQLRLTQ